MRFIDLKPDANKHVVLDHSPFLFIDIVDIKPANMEELTEVITAAEFHPNHCNYFVYSSSKGIIRLCDMRAAALCDTHAKGKGSFYDSYQLTMMITSLSGTNLV